MPITNQSSVPIDSNRDNFRWVINGRICTVDELTLRELKQAHSLYVSGAPASTTTQMLAVEIRKRLLNANAPAANASSFSLGGQEYTPAYMDFTNPAVLSRPADDLFAILVRYARPSVTAFESFSYLLLATPTDTAVLVSLTNSPNRGETQLWTNNLEDLTGALEILAASKTHTRAHRRRRLTLPLTSLVTRDDVVFLRDIDMRPLFGDTPEPAESPLMPQPEPANELSPGDAWTAPINFNINFNTFASTYTPSYVDI